MSHVALFLHGEFDYFRCARRQLSNNFTAVAFLPTFFAKEKSWSPHGWSEKKNKKITSLQGPLFLNVAEIFPLPPAIFKLLITLHFQIVKSSNFQINIVSSYTGSVSIIRFNRNRLQCWNLKYKSLDEIQRLLNLVIAEVTIAFARGES